MKLLLAALLVLSCFCFPDKAAAQDSRARSYASASAQAYQQEEVGEANSAASDDFRAVRFTPAMEQPLACSQATFGSVAMNSYYQLCICVPGAGWIYINTDVQCVWH